MPRKWILLAAAPVFCASAPLLGQSASQPVPAIERQALGLQLPPLPAGPRGAKAQTIAALILGEPDSKAVDTLAAGIIAANEREETGIAEMELAFPGMKTAITDAMRPILENAQNEAWPLYMRDIASLYAQELNEAELDEAIAAYSGDAYAKLVRGMRERQDFAATAQEIGRSKDVSAEHLAKDLRIAGFRAAAELTPDERAMITSFSSSPTGRKIRAFLPRKIEIDVKWSNYTTPELDAQMEEAVIEAMAGHVAKSDKALGARMGEEMRKARDAKEKDAVERPNT